MRGGWVDYAISDPEMNLRELEESIRTFREYVADMRAEPRRSAEHLPAAPPDTRERALAEVIASDRARNPGVRALRHKNLRRSWLDPVELVPLGDVEAWVAERMSEPSQWAASHFPRAGHRIEVPYRYPGQGRRHLMYEVPRDPANELSSLDSPT